jgi:hypothetical protein
MISLAINLLLVIVILRLAYKLEKEVKIVYSSFLALDAEASNVQPTNPSPRVESPRVHPSAPAPLSSSAHGLSDEADVSVNSVDDVGGDGEDTTSPDYTRDTTFAANAASAAAMTSDDETSEVDLDGARPHSVEYSVVDYSKGLNNQEVEALPLGLGYNKEWPWVCSVRTYFQTQNSYQNKEFYKACGARWDPDWKYWSIPAGRDLRNAYNSGWLVGGEDRYIEALRDWLLFCRRPQVMSIVRRIIKDERRKMQHRRASQNHG